MNTVTIHLDTTRYLAPTDEDLAAAKSYILHRSEVAATLQSLIAELLTEAADKIVRIAYKYNFPGDVFTLGASPEQQREINAVMDALEEKILEKIEEITINEALSSIHPAESRESRKAALLAFLLALGHGNQNFRTTLYNYEWRFLYDLEAAIAALKTAGVGSPDAITTIRSHITAIYTIPALVAAIKHPQDFLAAFIRSAGITHNPDGSPNVQGVPREGYNAIINTILIANDIIFGKNQLLNFIADGAVGYYQLRGSNYPCTICDSEVGLHIGLIDAEPLPHPHCRCIRIPIYPLTK
jgi:hypothetical protein